MIELPTEAEPVRLVCGDALDVLRSLPDRSVDAVVTDPPYAVVNDAASGVSRSQRAVRETQFFEAWLREYVVELARVTKPTGAFWMTLDWRGAIALDKACGRLNLREPKVGVWDKETIGMGHVLRNSYECFAVVPMSGFERQTASEPDVWRHRWGQGERASDHPSEKPVDLIRRACDLVSPTGGLILDPLMGSGTTGVACVQMGRRFIGIELDPGHFATAQKRIDSALGVGGLFAPKPQPAVLY